MNLRKRDTNDSHNTQTTFPVASSSSPSRSISKRSLSSLQDASSSLSPSIEQTNEKEKSVFYHKIPIPYMLQNIYRKIALSLVIRRGKYRQVHSRRSRAKKILLLLFQILVLFQFSRWFWWFLFGHHSIRGGKLGPLFDNIGKEHLKKERVEKWGSLISTTELDDPRRNHEKIMKWHLESDSILSSMCSSSSMKPTSLEGTESASYSTIIPRFILQPKQDIFSLHDHWDHSYDRIILTDREMRLQMRDTFFPKQQLHMLYAKLPTWEDKVALWTLCAMYYHGGIYISEQINSLHSIHPLPNINRENDSSLACQPSNAFVIISENEDINSSEKPSISMDFLIASPKHHSLLRVIENLPHELPPESMKTKIEQLLYEHMVLKSGPQTEASKKTTLLSQQCEACDTANSNNSDVCCNIMFKDTTLFSMQKHITNDNAMTHILQPGPVSVKEKEGTIKFELDPKIPIQVALVQHGCEPSFLCNRCLRYGPRGSYPQCSFVCSQCYLDTICSPPLTKRKKVAIDVFISSSMSNPSVKSIGDEKHPRNDNDKNNQKKLIPRIIHQTWFEDLSPSRYPDLVRLQNSWKSLGWDYRFYNDHSARELIKQHYPERFLYAYNSLIPGAYKADFFRYLVLLLHGGVYADIDVMLDTSLDDFITPEMAFFAPRDTPGEWMDEEFCLWNGFVGSSPGHPFILEAVERSLNLIINKADLFDMEKDICAVSGIGMEWWKIRVEPGLSLTGPCALGIAMNLASGHDPLKKVELGWVRSDVSKDLRGYVNGKPGGGDTLILSVSSFLLISNTCLLF